MTKDNEYEIDKEIEELDFQIEELWKNMNGMNIVNHTSSYGVSDVDYMTKILSEVQDLEAVKTILTQIKK